MALPCLRPSPAKEFDGRWSTVLGPAAGPPQGWDAGLPNAARQSTGMGGRGLWRATHGSDLEVVAVYGPDGKCRGVLPPRRAAMLSEDYQAAHSAGLHERTAPATAALAMEMAGLLERCRPKKGALLGPAPGWLISAPRDAVFGSSGLAGASQDVGISLARPQGTVQDTCALCWARSSPARC